MKLKKRAEYNPRKIEGKWQKYWLSKKTFAAGKTGKKKMILVEFPFPSGAGLHMGHMRPFVAGDVVSKYFKMQGFNVMYPMGWDAFGLPAENYAIKNKVHPSVSTKKNITNAKRQLISWGTGYDWAREINTTDPNYYKWTQKLFLEFYKAGLAYEKLGEVNWCPKDKTGLANEEVIDGKCERCGTEVEKKTLRQWYLKITEYAEKLLEGLKDLPEWPESVKLQQENWIGKSVGALVKFPFTNRDGAIKVFTTRIDTIFSGTFVVLAPEHELLSALKSEITNYDEVEKYIQSVKNKSETDRTDKENKTGVELKGVTVKNPATNEEMPVWVSDFVLGSYGTGSVFADAHDKRDFDMAKKYSIPLKVSIKPVSGDAEKIMSLEECFEEEGILFNSKQFDGLSSAEARPRIIAWLQGKGLAEEKISYKLRDWVFSRQRYWGEPIPLIHCDKCGIVPVPEKDLPIKLPNVKNYEPTGTGESPLAAIDKWVNTKCPKCAESEKKTKYLVFDYDGVIGDTAKSNLLARIDIGWAKDEEESYEKMLHYFTRRPFHANGHGMTEDEEKTLLKKFVEFGKAVNKRGFKNFDGFVNEIKKIKNAKIAIVSSGSEVYVEKGVKLTGLKNIEFLAAEHSLSKEEKIKTLAKKWKVDIKDIYYFTDATCDYHELKDLMNPKKIIGCAWGYIGFDYLVKDMPENQILKSFKDIHNIFKPGIAKRETNTMPQWAGSSWYWLRYMDPKNKKEFSDKKLQKYWSPVDLYFGGMEHTTLHLLYSRFWNLFFYDRKLVTVKEPYKKRVPHGIILGPDGEKMSKSRGNVVNSDEVIKIYGTDTTRLYMMFLGPHGAQVSWNDKGIVGTRRFLERVWAMQDFISKSESEDVTLALHKMIKKVTEDIETFSFNTAVSAMMIFANTVYESKTITKKTFESFLTLLAIFAPHMTEEIWTNLGNKKTIFASKWPKYNPSLLQAEKVTVVVQINGKLKAELSLDRDIDDEIAKREALRNPKITEVIGESQIKRVIVVKNRLINIVI